MKLFGLNIQLCGSFRLDLATERTFPWNGEGHMPKIIFRVGEFHADVCFAVFGPANGNDVALDGLCGVIVHKL